MTKRLKQNRTTDETKDETEKKRQQHIDSLNKFLQRKDAGMVTITLNDGT